VIDPRGVHNVMGYDGAGRMTVEMAAVPSGEQRTRVMTYRGSFLMRDERWNMPAHASRRKVVDYGRDVLGHDVRVWPYGRDDHGDRVVTRAFNEEGDVLRETPLHGATLTTTVDGLGRALQVEAVWPDGARPVGYEQAG